MSSVMKGALNKMTIKQAFDEVNATDEQKKNGLNRLLQSDKKRSFIPQIKRYAAAAAAVVVAAGTAGVGIHFAVINNQGGPINVSIGGNSTADSIITPSENTKVHSEKSGMTFVDDKTFWAQLGKITYRRIDNTPTIDTTEINAGLLMTAVRGTAGVGFCNKQSGRTYQRVSIGGNSTAGRITITLSISIWKRAE